MLILNLWGIKMKKHNDLKKQKKLKFNINKLILNFIIPIFIILMVFSLIKICTWYRENKASKQVLQEISNSIEVFEDEDVEQNKEEKYKINFEELKNINNEVVAWLKVNNTKIEYPVVKAKNNDYYLKYSFDKTYNEAGWIFADYKNKFNGEDKNIVIYGHNRKDGSMFGSLKDTLNEIWFNDDDNRNIVFITEQEVSTYRVFSIYQIKKEDYYIKTDFKDNEFKKFIETLKKRSIKEFDEEISESSHILTLSTCGNNNKYRTVLHAVKVGEEI